MLVRETFDRVKFRDLIDKIFSLKDRQKSLDLINQHSKFWDQIIGTRGFTGKKTTNAHTQFNNLFEVESTRSSDEFDESLLDQLENLNAQGKNSHA
jgi:hypothetical protein